MTRWIVRSSLRLTAAVLVAAVAVIVLGILQLRQASVDTLPEFGRPQVQVQTEALGLSAGEVEQLITIPLEDEFNGLPFMSSIRSQSIPGLSAIELTFEPGTDIYRARQLVDERVAQGPTVVNVGTPPVMIQPTSSTGRVMMIGLHSTSVSPIEVSTIARWRIRPRLLAVPGVANVSIWGQRDQQLQVLVDPARLRKAGVSLDQVINTTGDAMWTSPLTFIEASSPGTDGFIDTPNQRITLQHLLPITDAKQLGEVPIEEVQGAPIKLGQVTTVVEDHPALRGDAVLAGGGTGFLLVVEKLPGANTAEVTRGVEEALDALKPGLTGITVDSDVFRPASYVSSALHNVGIAALIGLVLVVAWLGVAWRSWRVALIGLVSILLSYVGAALVLYAIGTTFNSLVLTGLVVAVGVIVDDVVVGVDAMKRRLAGGRDHEGAEPGKGQKVTEAITGARRPLGYALLVILLAALPLWLLTGFAGALAKPLVGAYALAVLASTVVALVVAPALGYVLLPTGSHARNGKSLAGRVEATLGGRLGRLTSRTGVAWATVGVLVLMGLALVPQFGRNLVPTLKDRDLVVAWQAMPATSLPEMQRIINSATDNLRSVRGVGDVATNVGQALMGDQIVDVNAAQTFVTIKSDADYGDTYARIQHVLAGYPGISHRLSTYPAQAIAAEHVDTGTPLTVRLYGTDQQVMRVEAEQIRQLLGGVEGVADARVDRPVQQPSIEIGVNIAAAAKYGLKPGDVRRSSAVLVGGIPVGSFYQNQQIFDVAVWSTPQVRANLSTIENLLVDTPSGRQVPLKDVATVKIAPTPTVIKHDNVSRYIDVTADVHGSTASVVDRVNDRLDRIALPLGYHAEVFSDLSERHHADLRTTWYVLACAAGVYLLLQAAFRSWGRALLVFLAAPLAAAGGAVTALIAGVHITTGALVGFLTVFAIALRNAVRMVRRAQEWEAVDPATHRAGTGPSEAIRLAAREQSVPVIATAVGVLLILLPLLFRGTIPGVEFIRPLALVVFGGLVTATVTTLFVVPALYARYVRPTGEGGRPVVVTGAPDPVPAAPSGPAPGGPAPGGPTPGGPASGGPAPGGPTPGGPASGGPAPGGSATAYPRPMMSIARVGGSIARAGGSIGRARIGSAMRPRTRRGAALAAALLLAVAAAGGCAKGEQAAGEAPQPAELEAVPGTSVHRVILTEQAEQQVGIKVADVAPAPAPANPAGGESASTSPTAPCGAGATAQMAEIPVTAVIYDPDGAAWTYTVAGTRAYVRVPVTVDHIDGVTAVLSRGPKIGTPVVVQGAPELLGVEYGVGEE